MFAETAIAVFILGFLAGCLVAWWGTRPITRELDDLRTRMMREARQKAYRSEYRRDHLGTPYISPAPSHVEKLLADIGSDGWVRVRDDHNGSRKASELRVVR